MVVAEADHNDDAVLWVSFSEAGQSAALASLMERHYDSALAVARQVCRHPDRAEDALQEAMLGLIRRGSGFDPSRSSFRNWWLQVVRNQARMTVRGDGRQHALVQRAGQLSTAPPTPPVAAEAVAQREERDAVLAACAALPNHEREVIRQRYWEGASYADIATRLQRSENTIRSQARRGLARLRESLAERGRPVSTVALVLAMARWQGGAAAADPGWSASAALADASATPPTSSASPSWLFGGGQWHWLASLSVCLAAALAVTWAGHQLTAEAADPAGPNARHASPSPVAVATLATPAWVQQLEVLTCIAEGDHAPPETAGAEMLIFSLRLQVQGAASGYVTTSAGALTRSPVDQQSFGLSDAGHAFACLPLAAVPPGSRISYRLRCPQPTTDAVHLGGVLLDRQAVDVADGQIWTGLSAALGDGHWHQVTLHVADTASGLAVSTQVGDEPARWLQPAVPLEDVTHLMLFGHVAARVEIDQLHITTPATPF